MLRRIARSIWHWLRKRHTAAEEQRWLNPSRWDKLPSWRLTVVLALLPAFGSIVALWTTLAFLVPVVARESGNYMVAIWPTTFLSEPQAPELTAAFWNRVVVIVAASGIVGIMTALDIRRWLEKIEGLDWSVMRGMLVAYRDRVMTAIGAAAVIGLMLAVYRAEEWLDLHAAFETFWPPSF